MELKAYIRRRFSRICLMFCGLITTVTCVIHVWAISSPHCKHPILQQVKQEGHSRPINNEMSGRSFQLVTEDKSLYAYSAYCDPRDGPKICVFVIIANKLMKVPFVCTIHYKNGKTKQVDGTFKLLWTIIDTLQTGVIKCPLDHTKDFSNITAVSIRPRYCKTVLDHSIPVLKTSNKKNTLTRCYPVIHSNFSNYQRLIWNIEISKLSGVDKFIFYNHSTSPNVDKVLRHYMKEGTVEVRPWDMPDYVRNLVHYWAQTVAIQDCVYSEMFSTRYALVGDLDELFLPRNGLSLVQLADKTFDYRNGTAKSNLASVLFKCLSVLRNSSIVLAKKRPANSYVNLKPIPTNDQRSDIEPLLYTTFYFPKGSTKAMIIPERVDTMFVHDALYIRRGFKQRALNMDTEAVLLHYRDSPRHMESNPTFYQFTDVLSYSRQITAVIVNKTKQIFPFKNDLHIL